MGVGKTGQRYSDLRYPGELVEFGPEGETDQQVPPPQVPTTEDRPLGYRGALEQLGIDWDTYKANAVKATDLMGLRDNQWDDENVNFQIAFRRGLAAFGPQGDSVAQQIYNDVFGQEGIIPEQGTVEAGPAPAPRQIEEDNRRFARRQRMRELYTQLHEAPFMRTWWGVLSYILLAVATRSPSFAAKVMLSNPNQGRTYAELMSLKEEIRSDIRNEEREEERGYQMRRLAADWIRQRSTQNLMEKNRLHRLWLDTQKELKEDEKAAQDDVIKKLERELAEAFRDANLAMKEGRDPMTGAWLKAAGKPVDAKARYDAALDQIQGLRQLLARRRGVIEEMRKDVAPTEP